MAFPARITVIAGTLGLGGAERQLYHQVRALRARGADVQVLCLTKGEFWEEPLRETGADVRSVGRVGIKAVRALRIACAVRRHGSQVVQSAHFYTNLYAVFAARTGAAREIGAVRADATSEVAANGVFGKPSLRWPRMLAVNSRRGLRNAVELGVPEDRLAYVPNCVDTDAYRPRPKAASGRLEVLAVGRLVEQKRFDVLLRALARLPEAAVRCTIVGRGPLRRRLEGLAGKLGLGPQALMWLGERTDMPALYAAADALALSSDWEGTPNVVLEAMACGLPVVATAVGGTAARIRDGVNGLLVPAGDPAALADALHNLARAPALRRRLGAAARAHVEESCSPSRLMEALAALYARVLP